MNNKINFYRLEHFTLKMNGEFRFQCGPYKFAQFTRDEKLSEHLWKNEPCQKYYNNRSNAKVTPTTFRWERPGPWEDPVLREQWAKRRTSRMDVSNNSKLVFGFDSLDQCRDWHFDEEEVFILGHRGFVVNQFLVPAKNFLKGLRQCVYVDDGSPIKHQRQHTLLHVFKDYYIKIGWSLNEQGQPVKVS